MVVLSDSTAVLSERFAVRGMTCASCAKRVEGALSRVPGVQQVSVDFPSATATIWHEPTVGLDERLKEAVADLGYALEAPGMSAGSPFPWRALAAGLIATSGLLAFYLGLLALAQGWEHAFQLLGEDRWFVGAIALGFGVQVGLFFYLRGLHARMSARGVAASSGASTATMLACCAHHLTDILPIVGLSGAALVLAEYKTPLLWFGLLSNLAGVAYMAHRVHLHQSGKCHPGASAASQS